MMNAELRQLFQDDQAERQGELSSRPPAYWEAVGHRDRARRERAGELIAAGALQEAEDYYHAAMLFQHGAELDDYWRAHELARQAAGMGYQPARWLTAAAYDRWLAKQGRPQKYGTQYKADGRRYQLLEVGPTTTDVERLEWGVPILAEAARGAEELTRQYCGSSAGRE